MIDICTTVILLHLTDTVTHCVTSVAMQVINYGYTKSQKIWGVHEVVPPPSKPSRLSKLLTLETRVGYKYVSVFVFKYTQKHVFVSVFAIFKICVFVLVFDHCI